MTNFRVFLKNVATIVACFAVCMMFAGCNDDEGDNNPQEFTVAFDSNGGSDVPSQTVKDGEKATKPEDPTRSGYTFDEWYKEASFTNKWDFDSDAVNSNVTLHANWTNEAHPAGIEMIFVQGGMFTMGSEDPLDYDASPSHQVTLDSYSIGKYQVTQAQWLEVMGTTIQQQEALTGWGFAGVGDNYPMYYVSWNDIVGTSSSAVAYTVKGITYYQNGFCYKFSQLAGDGKQYRLPTEAEWEYAARGGNQSQGYIYSGSNTICDVAWYGENSNSSTQPVGTKSPNELGIFDMSCNVYEWCGDWRDSYTATAKTNPTGPTSGSFRVLRGGYWNSDAEYCRVAIRIGDSPDFRDATFGFRLAFSSE